MVESLWVRIKGETSGGGLWWVAVTDSPGRVAEDSLKNSNIFLVTDSGSHGGL